MLKVLAIKGSPRQESNSSKLLEQALLGIKSKEKIDLKTIIPAKLEIKPCIACAHCSQVRECIYKDDMPQLYQEFNQADLILVSTPVYFNGLPAQLKAMIDRCQVIWASKYVLNNSIINREKKRLAYLFITGGENDSSEQFLAVNKVMEMFFRVINANLKGTLTQTNVDKIPVIKKEDILAKAYKLGKELVTI